MKKYFSIISIFILTLAFTSDVFSQNQNVSINNTGSMPDASAMLDVSATDKGILIPRMSSDERTAIANPAKGLLVFDNTFSQFWFYNGAEWLALTGGGAADGGTLDEAYNFGGSGAGRIITIDNGQVEFQTGTNNVKIGYTGASTAILEIASTEKGLLIPRMSSAQRNVISSPATGLMVYDTDLNQFWYFDGTQWTALIGGGASGATITAFYWTDGTDLLTITEDGTDWDVTIDNEADDLSDNFINDLSDVNATPSNGQVLKWDTDHWEAGVDESGSGGATINTFYWDDGTDLLTITEGTTDWDVTIDNEADDLSDNIINDLSNVNATPSVDDFLQWDGSEWIAGSVAAGSCTTLDEAYDCGGSGTGRIITADAGSVEINSTSEFKPLLVTNSGANTFVISAEHSNTGVSIAAGSTNASNTYSTIQATTNSSSDVASAILGSSTGTAWGVTGQVEASGSATAGIHGNNLRTTGGYGVYGIGVNGVVGETNYGNGYGVWGENHDNTGATTWGVGTFGRGYVGVWGEDNGGGTGTGYGVVANGELGATGTKSFLIDHPLDPENKILRHFSAESPEVLNIYRGNIILNNEGEAEIDLPDYFSEININFSYYLTPVGGAAPNLHVKEEVKGNSFVIAGGEENLKVSWVLYAERNDAYVQKYPKSKQIEVDKKKAKGKYLRPDLYGKTKKDAIVPGIEYEIENNPEQNILK